MKKIFISTLVIISALVLMLFAGSNFMQAAEQAADKGVITTDVTVDKGAETDKDAMLKEADKMIKEGQAMVERGIQTNDFRMKKNGMRMTKDGMMMKKKGQSMPDKGK